MTADSRCAGSPTCSMPIMAATSSAITSGRSTPTRDHPHSFDRCPALRPRQDRTLLRHRHQRTAARATRPPRSRPAGPRAGLVTDRSRPPAARFHRRAVSPATPPRDRPEPAPAPARRWLATAVVGELDMTNAPTSEGIGHVIDSVPPKGCRAQIPTAAELRNLADLPAGDRRRDQVTTQAGLPAQERR